MRALLGIEATAERGLDEPDPAPQLVERHPAEAAAEHPGGALARPRLGRGDPKQRRLAGAVRADDPPVLALPGRPVDPVEDDLPDAVRGAPEADLLEPDGLPHPRGDSRRNAATLGRMRGRVAVLIAGLVAATTLVPIAGASLAPAEQAWAGPLIKIWNVQNASLKVVISQALKKNALVAGSKPDNLNLTNTLVALANCKQPKDRIRAAGAPPTTRLVPFRDALNSACIHDQNGANDFAKAIGAVTKGRATAGHAVPEAGDEGVPEGDVAAREGLQLAAGPRRHRLQVVSRR